MPSRWAPGIFGLFLLETPHAHKNPCFRGGGLGFGFWREGSGSADFTFIGRRTNVQQLTCNIDDLSRSFYYLFFSFVLLELKPLVLKGKVPGVKL